MSSSRTLARYLAGLAVRRKTVVPCDDGRSAHAIILCRKDAPPGGRRRGAFLQLTGKVFCDGVTSKVWCGGEFVARRMGKEEAGDGLRKRLRI